MSEFNNLSNGNLPNNYYSSKVKEGIPIFQEENVGNLYNNYIDPFKLLETEKNNNIFNLGINNFNMNMTDIQTRKIFEKEMEPYLMRMKNELNLIIERFRKELEVKSNHFNEIEEMKQEMIKIRQNSEDIYKNFELKFLNMNDNLNKHDKTLNNLQSEMFQMNHLNKSSNDIFLKNEIDNLKNKMINLDANNEKYLKETTKNLEKIIDYKFDKINQNINFIKEENNNIKNELVQNNIKIEMINSENNKKNERLNDFNSEFNSISNQINKISIHNNKVMNLINNLEINNNECQQKMKNLNEKFSSLNENFDIINNETKNQKENFNSNLKLISELESNLNALENEKNSLNNKITELNIKLEYQEEKLSKNNNIMNNAQNGNNNMLYKDISNQIAKSKKIIDDMREKYDKEVLDLKNNLNQFDLMLKNNPYFQMNENERISILFKKEQVNCNETFRQQIKLLNEEIKKIKTVSQFDKNNLEIINKNFKKHTNDINMLEQSLKSWTQIAQILSKNYEKLKKDKGDDKSSNNYFNNFNFDESLNKINKYIENNKNDVYKLKIDVKEINEKTIPEIYRYINEQLKIKPSKFSQNIMADNNIKIKNTISSVNKNNNNNFISTNKNNDFFDNKNNNNDFNDKIESKRLEDLVSKIELMGSAAPNMNNKFNENNKNNKENSSFNNSFSEGKKEDNDLIKELGEENTNSNRKNNNEFDSNFDD